MPQFAAPADLKQFCSEKLLAQLADDVTASPDYNESGTQAVLTEALVQASNQVRSYLFGRITDFSDSQVAADLKRWTVLLALYSLYLRRGHYGPANPYQDSYRAAIDELKAIRDGKLQTGTTETPVIGGGSTTEHSDPVFSKAASGGNGTDSDLLVGF